jgi:hypothetical protein
MVIFEPPGGSKEDTKKAGKSLAKWALFMKSWLAGFAGRCGAQTECLCPDSRKVGWVSEIPQVPQVD